jgi:hypothetical protein
MPPEKQWVKEVVEFSSQYPGSPMKNVIGPFQGYDVRHALFLNGGISGNQVWLCDDSFSSPFTYPSV